MPCELTLFYKNMGGAHFPLTLVAVQDKPGAERPTFTGVSQRLRLPISLEHGLAYGNLQGHPQSLREQPSGPKSRRVKCLHITKKWMHSPYGQLLFLSLMTW